MGQSSCGACMISFRQTNELRSIYPYRIAPYPAIVLPRSCRHGVQCREEDQISGCIYEFTKLYKCCHVRWAAALDPTLTMCRHRRKEAQWMITETQKESFQALPGLEPGFWE